MATRTITLRAFCSAKGGVGKSALAVTAAKLLAARRKGAVVLIDADMTGTSLVDGLRLCAPRVKLRDDGAADLYADPVGIFLSRDETLKLREERRQSSWDVAPPPPPFLNDILTAQPDDNLLQDPDDLPECCLSALYWRHERDDGVRYFPSSPMRKDISIAMGWLYRQAQLTQPLPWIRRVAWMLEGLRAQMPDVTDIVLDLPPNLVGFAYEALAFMAHLMREPLPPGYPVWREGSTRWDARPILVTTPDRNDLFAAVDYALEHRSDMPALQIVVNRLTESAEKVREAVRERYAEGSNADELIRRDIPELRDTLGMLFREPEELDLADEIVQISPALRLDDAKEDRDGPA